MVQKIETTNTSTNIGVTLSSEEYAADRKAKQAHEKEMKEIDNGMLKGVVQTLTSFVTSFVDTYTNYNLKEQEAKNSFLAGVVEKSPESYQKLTDVMGNIDLKKLEVEQRIAELDAEVEKVRLPAGYSFVTSLFNGWNLIGQKVVEGATEVLSKAVEKMPWEKFPMELYFAGEQSIEMKKLEQTLSAEDTNKLIKQLNESLLSVSSNLEQQRRLLQSLKDKNVVDHASQNVASVR
jgi:predicted nucleic acid-binding protein